MFCVGLFLYAYALENVDTCPLGDYAGLRCCLKSIADDWDLTGTAQRIGGRDVEVIVEGKQDDINRFEDNIVESDRILGNFKWLRSRSLHRRFHKKFTILPDKVYKKSMNNPLGVETGMYSDHEYEISPGSDSDDE